MYKITSELQYGRPMKGTRKAFRVNASTFYRGHWEPWINSCTYK